MSRRGVSLDVIQKEIVETEEYLRKYRDIRSSRFSSASEKKSREDDANAAQATASAEDYTGIL
jgi:hypothetical protein